MPEREMPAHLVVDVFESLVVANIPVWMDGGWGIDALVGEQTRVHEDLDLVIALEDVDRAMAVLGELGFGLGVDERPTKVEFYDADDRKIGFHTVAFRRDGSGVQVLQDGTEFIYRSKGFTGRGRIAGVQLPCLTPQVQVECHLGYEPDEGDFHDMRLLRDHFGIDLPPPYADDRRPEA